MFRLPTAQRRIEKRQTAQIDHGISITPMPITMNEEVTITYDGHLAQNNAQAVYLHVGSGDVRSWENVQDIQMEKVNDAWVANIVPTDSRLNFCFHDGANNWDNNYNLNWSVTVHNGRQI
ncbi:MAG TPA: carbohydrate-binding protein [Peptococcaceae bacterium]|jgi:hypothetical protein|nr:carbohydrate-binding protein [Clostridia bacterium]HOB81839.1 carbohydrate-binding protein [Peptococcaceae bacterium]HPZ71226.1 carbohydrate-binding protein [Peptococcaceae bacterium]HQD53807.1 carbohydrate-binding protein [Peptococcaceae bacterium]